MTNSITNLVYVVNPLFSVETDWSRFSHYFGGGFSWGFYVLAAWWVVFIITRTLRPPRWPNSGE